MNVNKNKTRIESKEERKQEEKDQNLPRLHYLRSLQSNCSVYQGLNYQCPKLLKKKKKKTLSLFRKVVYFWFIIGLFRNKPNLIKKFWAQVFYLKVSFRFLTGIVKIKKKTDQITDFILDVSIFFLSYHLKQVR